ncbi:MAG: septal ring lytic transglycosylase RlpA family protein [Spirochaetaceae bacterium]|nr:septal ring lytic transglycosylase RlpA family protein [Spirochaetaceae bacterium]
MKRIGVVCVFFLGFGGFLLAQSDELSSLETESPGFSASAADIVPTTASNFRQEGVASWYGAEFAGRATASGEIFDPAQLTAAHAELPFGTYLTVTNTENGKKIAVRVNDRGPFVRSRILDVSRAAAERLDMLSAGTAKVVIEATTSETAQSLVRELGMNPLSVARAAPPRAANTPSGTATPAAQPSVAAASSGTAAPAAQPTAAPADTPSAVPAADTQPVTPAPSGDTASDAQPSTATAPSDSTASDTQPPAASADTPSAVPAPSGSAASSAASTVPATAAGVPVMSPTAPRTPAQSPVVPPLAPSPSVSRVTGRVENIPEIRRPTDSGYVVVDEQVTPAPVIAPASRTAASGTAPAASVPRATASPVTPTPSLAAAPRTAAPAVTSVAAEPQSTVPPQDNPAASVPVTNPQPADKVEFTGSPMVQGKNYRVQVGSFTDLKNASDVFLRLFDAGLNPSYEHYDDKYYRVVITNVKAEDADDLSRKLAEIGITEALSREDTSR